MSKKTKKRRGLLSRLSQKNKKQMHTKKKRIFANYMWQSFLLFMAVCLFFFGFIIWKIIGYNMNDKEKYEKEALDVNA